jgi:hypothetical protein
MPLWQQSKQAMDKAAKFKIFMVFSAVGATVAQPSPV